MLVIEGIIMVVTIVCMLITISKSNTERQNIKDLADKGVFKTISKEDLNNIVRTLNESGDYVMLSNQQYEDLQERIINNILQTAMARGDFRWRGYEVANLNYLSTLTKTILDDDIKAIVANAQKGLGGLVSAKNQVQEDIKNKMEKHVHSPEFIRSIIDDINSYQIKSGESVSEGKR